MAQHVAQIMLVCELSPVEDECENKLCTTSFLNGGGLWIKFKWNLEHFVFFHILCINLNIDVLVRYLLPLYLQNRFSPVVPLTENAFSNNMGQYYFTLISTFPKTEAVGCRFRCLIPWHQ